MASKILLRHQEDENLSLVKKVATGNLAFAIDLYRLASSRDDENVFFSPASINIALAMTRVGARNETLKQLTKALNLHLLDNEQDIHSAYSTLNETFNSENEQLILRIANRMYLQESYEILKEFTEALKSSFKTEVGIVDFVKNASKTSEEINQWVEGVTNQKIKNLIAPSMLTPDTRLVLVNAVYFKGDWRLQFEETNTKPMDFHVSASKDVKLDMMIQKDDFCYAESSELDCKVLQLTYLRSKFSMLVLLPNQIEGLDQLTSNLTVDAVNNVVNSLQSEKVTVKLPKFKLETDYELNDLLKGLGICDLFYEKVSDLSGVNGETNLYVSKVIHKTFLDVNEFGSEAAASTAVLMVAECLSIRLNPSPEFEFIADHPFLFLIRDHQSELAVFMGCFRNPGSK